MRTFRVFSALLGLALLMAAYLPSARADEWDKTTKVTFKEPVQVPGKVLQPGTYVFKLLDSTSDRHVVQIFNEDHTQLITTVLAVPNQRLEAAGKTILTYDERPADQPMALAAWFYPGDNFGQEFVYPKSEAEQLSKLNNREVPSTNSDEAYPKLQDRSAETAAQNQNPAPQNQNPAPQPTAPQVTSPPANPSTATAQAPPPESKPENTQVAANHENQLPHTASTLPLYGFLGFALLGIAGLLRAALRA